MGIRIGVQLGLGLSDLSQLHDTAQMAEELGYDVLYFPDHLLLEGPERQRMDGVAFDSIAMATIAAQATKRVRIGHTVLCNLFRHPAVTAQSIATLDHVSQGRALLGIGTGWTETEFRMTGIPFPPIKERLRMLDEALTCIRGLWGDAPFSYEGEFFHFQEADLGLRPVQKPLPPILLGGGGKGLLRVAARHADVLNLIAGVGQDGYISVDGASKLDDEAFLGKIDFVRSEAGKLGRDGQAIEISNFVFAMAMADSAEASKQIQADMGTMFGLPAEAVCRAPMALVGTPEEMVAELTRRIAEWGVKEAVIQAQDPAVLERFAREALPALHAL